MKGVSKAGETQAAWDSNIAAVKALHVMLVPDSGGWFAQGLEIDYAACGSTPDEAKNNFGQGLSLTLCEHLLMYGHIKKVLVVAPQEAWEEYFQTPAEGIQKQTCDLVTFLQETTEKKPKLEQVEKAFPFNSIEFIHGQVAAV